MPLYTHENYCQEVWDLGRAISKFNDFLCAEYWQICEPLPMRKLYRFIRYHIIKFVNSNIDDDTYEEDIFMELTQGQFNKYTDYYNEKLCQFPKRDIIFNYIDNIFLRLRDLNNWLNTAHGQNADWWRVYKQFKNDILSTWWNNNELMNYLPDVGQSQPPSQQT